MIAYKNGRFAVSRKMDATPERIWEVLTDTTKWPEWGPSITAVECRHRFIKPFSKGYVKTSLGFRLPFTITSYQHLQFWNWRVGGVEATGHRLIRHQEGCSVLFDMPWWALPYTVICLLALKRIARLCGSTL